MTDEARKAAATAPLEAALGEPHARVRRFWLTVESGADAGLRHASSSDRVVVGTHDSVDVRLNDETVSRFHCEVSIVSDDVVVRDLNSRNGTSVDSVRVREAFLRDGSAIAVGRSILRFELRTDEVRIPVSESTRFGAMIGRGIAMRRAFALLERAATTDASILLEGETGTGKELAAESIHAANARRDGPLVVVDCGAIPPDLLEAELFGHEKGAFTGALTAREGAFAAANGGTVLLDEIGELPPELQPKLLRVLEKKQVKRLGTPHPTPVDVRIIAATNRSLDAEVNEKRFRSDLYYRLAVVKVRLPPLRERPEDLPELVDGLLEGLGAPPEAAAELRSPESIAELARHRWSGNVRELRNYLERCLALRVRLPIEGPTPTDDGQPDFDQPLRIARERWSRTFERRYVTQLLSRHQDNVSAAARAAGVDRMHFYRLLWRHGLR